MIRIPHDTTLGTAARRMQEANEAIALVVDGDDLPVGVLTERQLLAAMAASRHPDIAAAGSWMVPVLIDADGARSLPDVRTTARIGMATRDAART